MNQPDERLRPHPSTRLAGPVVSLNLPDLARALHVEPHPAKGGHRQAGWFIGAPPAAVVHLRTRRSAAGASSPGHVVIHCLRGELAVEVSAAQHRLGGGEALVLEPDVPHSVEAVAESEMLLTVCIG